MGNKSAIAFLVVVAVLLIGSVYIIFDHNQSECSDISFETYWNIAMESERNREYYNETPEDFNMTLRNDYYYRCQYQ